MARIRHKNNEPPTSCIKHLAVSGLSSVPACIKSSCNLIGNRFEMPNVSYTQTLGHMLKNRPQIQAHLVFADTQSPNKKPKELEFCQRTTETELETKRQK